MKSIIRLKSKSQWLVLKLRNFCLDLVVELFYMPNNILHKNKNNKIEIKKVKVGKKYYTVVQIRQGRIFTDRACNITVMHKKSLVPRASWQYENKKVLQDSSNYVLNGVLKIKELPKKTKSTLVSIISGGGANYNYYHWLYDCLPRLYLARAAFGTDKMVKYYVPEKTYGFQKQTLEALGINDSCILSSDNYNHLKASRLVATSHPNLKPQENPKWIYNYLRNNFLPAEAKTKAYSQFIYISRADSINKRRVINEDKLLKPLKTRGFYVFKLSSMSFQEQVALFSNARIIIAPHGAGLANLTFAPKGAIVFELFHEKYQPKMYERISQYGGLEYHKILCSINDNTEDPQKEDLVITEKAIKTILKQLDKTEPSLDSKISH